MNGIPGDGPITIQGEIKRISDSFIPSPDKEFDRLALNRLNLEKVMDLCIKNRVHQINYGDIQLVFQPEKAAELPTGEDLDMLTPTPTPTEDQKYNPDYLLENPPMM